jgi:hypothetical protein
LEQRAEAGDELGLGQRADLRERQGGAGARGRDLVDERAAASDEVQADSAPIVMPLPMIV